MTATSRTAGDGSGDPTAQMPAISADDAPLVTSAVSGDRCTTCGAPMASDQRYCVECGARRGRPRFEVSGTPAPREPLAGAPIPPRRMSMSAGTTLIAGVATLLLALGVGVLIGHSNSTTTTKQPAAQVITVSGGGGGTSSGTAGGASSSNATTSGGNAKHHGTTTKISKPKHHLASKQAASAATQAASQTLKTNSGVKIAPASQTQGGACAAGTAGCQNGHFTGNFFGGG